MQLHSSCRLRRENYGNIKISSNTFPYKSKEKVQRWGAYLPVIGGYTTESPSLAHTIDDHMPVSSFLMAHQHTKGHFVLSEVLLEI